MHALLANECHALSLDSIIHFNPTKATMSITSTELSQHCKNLYKEQLVCCTLDVTPRNLYRYKLGKIIMTGICIGISYGK